MVESWFNIIHKSPIDKIAFQQQPFKDGAQQLMFFEYFLNPFTDTDQVRHI